MVTSYRYFDDITVFSIIDLGTGRVVDVQAAQHLRTPLSDDEFDEAQTLAQEKSDEVKQLYERFGEADPRRPAIQPVQRQGRPAGPSGRASDLPGGKAGAELSPPPGRPDDPHGRDARPRAPARRRGGSRDEQTRRHRSRANPINSEPMDKTKGTLHVPAADPHGPVSRAFGSGSSCAPPPSHSRSSGREPRWLIHPRRK